MVSDLATDEGWSRLLQRLPADLDLAATARARMAFRRRRGVRSAEDLLRLALVYGGTERSLRSTAAWAALTGCAQVSDVALLYRLQAAGGWLETVLGAVLAPRLRPTADAPMRQLRVVDATTVAAPGLGRLWRVHATYDLASASFTRFALTDQHVAESFERTAVQPGEILLGDRIYAQAQPLHLVVAAGAQFIVRRGITSCRLLHPDGRRFDLKRTLAGLAKRDADLPVLVPRFDAPGMPPLAARLIIRHLGPSAAKARERARRKAVKNSRRAAPKCLDAAEHLMLLTSLDGASASLAQVLALYRLRWQIEIAFKRLKGLVRLDDLQAKDPPLVRAALLAKLIVAALTEDGLRQVLDSPPWAGR